jgi:hypothetical protein
MEKGGEPISTPGTQAGHVSNSCLGQVLIRRRPVRRVDRRRDNGIGVTSMGLTLYFIGAGLTKSLELTRRVPLMMDFVPVLADYCLNSDVVLNALVQMEIGRVYETACDDCLSLAEQIGRDVPAADRAIRDRFAALVRSRPPESVEALLERVESTKPDTVAAAYAHGLPALFRYAINDLFSTIGWDLNLDPLIRFLKRKFAEDASRTHVFVSFNYDLALDRAIELASDRDWQPQGGYGFEFPFYITDNSTACAAGPLPRSSPRIQILKPHGSLNWLRRRDHAGSMVLPLSEKMELRYWAIADPCHAINFPGQSGSPDFRSANVEILITPPSPTKVPVIDSVRSAECDAIKSADEVFVIGYSMPTTDRDQWSLISGVVGKREVSKLTVVNYNAPAGYFEGLRSLFQPLCFRKFNGGFAEFAAVG